MALKNEGRHFHLILTLALSAGFLFLAGCASLGKDECLNADWRSIGFEDGAHGYKVSRIGEHRKACAEYGVAPDFDLYAKGHREGLSEWCTPLNGYRLGSRGKFYNGVCPNDLEPAYLEAFNQGKAVHAYAREVNIQERNLKKMYADADLLDRELAGLEAELVSNGISPRRRRALLSEIRMREDDRHLLLTDIADAEQTVAQMRDNLQQMRVQNPYQ